MAKFIVYNIQLLPNEDSDIEVGISGYKKLFSKLRDLNSKHLKDKTQSEFHHMISTDIYFGPIDFRFPSKLVYGHFIRYRRTDKVTELGTGKNLYSSKGDKVGISSETHIPFVFDTSRHLFAIASISQIPKPSILEDILLKFLTPVAEDNFPNHSLTVDLLSKANGLEDVFKTAIAYKTVHFNLHAPNGHGAENILREMRDSKTQTISLQASAGKEGKMKIIPDFLMNMLRATPGLGWARITYFTSNKSNNGEDSKREVYDSREAPLTFTLRHGKTDKSEEMFLERVAEKLKTIDVNDPDEEDDSED